MKILVTGANGFIAKNLIAELKNRNYSDIFEYDLDTKAVEFSRFCKEAEFVFHLAGVNRSQEIKDFMKGNYGFTATLLEELKRNNNTCPIMISSSIQAALDNDYGTSKKAGEDILLQYAKDTGVPVYIYRLPNVFGKWCKPNYNSVIATFCYNIARNLPITVNNPNTILQLAYIDDVVEVLIQLLHGIEKKVGGFCEIPIIHKISLVEIVNLLYSFQNSRRDGTIPDMSDSFTLKLYSTYLSYLPEDDFSYHLNMHTDTRGSFTEIIKTLNIGQISVNITKPGFIKGNHWHHSKCEKFLVVSGTGVIRFRKLNQEKIIEYPVSGETLEVVDIPPGYTHHIENTGTCDLVTIMWANESFHPDKPDTYHLQV